MSRGNPNATTPLKREFDSEYQNLMAELGEGGAPSTQAGPGGPAGYLTNGSGGGGGPGGANQGAMGGGGGAPQNGEKRIPPWRIPENWFSNSESCWFEVCSGVYHPS